MLRLEMVKFNKEKEEEKEKRKEEEEKVDLGVRWSKS